MRIIQVGLCPTPRRGGWWGPITRLRSLAGAHVRAVTHMGLRPIPRLLARGGPCAPLLFVADAHVRAVVEREGCRGSQRERKQDVSRTEAEERVDGTVNGDREHRRGKPPADRRAI